MWGANKIARARNAEIQQKWIDKITCFDRSNNRSEVEELVSTYRNHQACRVVHRFQGAFNYCFKLRFDEDGQEWILRFPIEGDIMDPVRKVLREATVMRFVGEKTTIPVPKVIASGIAEGKFLGLGPFIIMEFVRGERLDECLFDEEDNLRQHIGDSTWEIIYRQMARIYLQLSAHSFGSIGGLHLDEASRDRSWAILSNPITLKMNELERLGGVVVKDHPGPFTITTEYLNHLTEESILHLRENPNSVDETEARDAYLSLYALKATAGHFTSKDDKNDHKLFGDDIRFGNILVDPETFQITAVLDFEFWYIAPAQFLNSPPPWLLLKEPWEWDQNDEEEYKVKLRLYTKIMEEEEEASGQDHSFSCLMQRYMDDGTFWYNLAVRESFCLPQLMKHCWTLKAMQGLEPPSELDSFLNYKMDQLQRCKGPSDSSQRQPKIE